MENSGEKDTLSGRSESTWEGWGEQWFVFVFVRGRSGGRDDVAAHLQYDHHHHHDRHHHHHHLLASHSLIKPWKYFFENLFSPGSEDLIYFVISCYNTFNWEQSVGNNSALVVTKFSDWAIIMSTWLLFSCLTLIPQSEWNRKSWLISPSD